MANTGNTGNNKQEEESEVYSIERIIGKRVSTETGRVEYLVRWAGYDESGDTWEEAMKLKGFACVREYEADEKKKTAAKRTSRGSGTGVQVRRASAIVGEKKTVTTPAVTKRKSQPATVRAREATTSESAKAQGSSSIKSTPKVKAPPVKKVPTRSVRFATASASNATTDQEDQITAVPEKVPTAPMTEEDAMEDDNSILEMPTQGKRYKIQDGLQLKEVAGVMKHTDGPMAMVQYTDSSYEIVPTKVLTETLTSAQVLIDYYESRLAVLT